MQVVSVSKGTLDVPALNYITSFGRGCQAIMRTAGMHEVLCVKGWYGDLPQFQHICLYILLALPFSNVRLYAPFFQCRACCGPVDAAATSGARVSVVLTKTCPSVLVDDRWVVFLSSTSNQVAHTYQRSSFLENDEWRFFTHLIERRCGLEIA